MSGNAGSGGENQAGTGGTDGSARTPDCGNTEAVKGAQHVRMDVSGSERTYWRWVPEGYDSNTPIPLVFAWHGSGGDGDEVRRTYFYLEPAVGDGAIIIYPDGLSVDGGSTGWDLEAEGIDVRFFDAMLEAASQNYCIDRTRVFSTGYSFGGMFSYALACSRGRELRGIAPTPGAFFGGSTCATPVPAWIATRPMTTWCSSPGQSQRATCGSAPTAAARQRRPPPRIHASPTTVRRTRRCTGASTTRATNGPVSPPRGSGRSSRTCSSRIIRATENRIRVRRTAPCLTKGAMSRRRDIE